MKRKCLFRKWIPHQYIACEGMGRQAVAGTGCWSEMDNCGYFHQWGLSTEETRETICNYTVGIVEQPSGYVFEVLPQHIRFVSEFPKLDFTA